MCEVIVVTSGKGGVGKTTTSANVGTGLASMGKKVALIDTDIGKEIDRFRRKSTPLQNRQLSQEKQKNEREHQQSNHMPVFVFRGIIPLLFILHFGYSNETTKIEKGEWRKKNSPYFSTELPPISAFHTKIGKDLYLRTIPSKFHSSHSHFLQFSPSS